MGRLIGMDPPSWLDAGSGSPRSGTSATDWVPDPARPGNLRRNLVVQVITPMFGGGVAARECDPMRPVSAKSVRGHLRFWWRATCGAAYKSVAALFKAESALFGSTQNRSPVVVGVEHTHCGSKIRVSALTGLEYVLFPFQEMRRTNTPAADGLENVVFTLRVSCPEKTADDGRDAIAEIETALWAWLNFGGVGARTRRGCGALYCEAFAPQSLSNLSKDWFRSPPDNAESATGASPRLWTTWPGTIIIGTVDLSANEACDAWRDAVAWMVRFRQRRSNDSNLAHLNLGRRPGHGNRPGRSLWPEAESIRNITGQRAKKHTLDKDIPAECIGEQGDSQGNPIDGAFPRAAFGLPIGFKFHPSDSGDPAPTELVAWLRSGNEPQCVDRMASRFIVRPMRDQLGRCRSAFIPLDGPWPDGVRLVDKSGSRARRGLPWDRPFDGPNGVVIGAKATRSPPVQKAEELAKIAKHKWATNAVDAFLDYLCSDHVGFTEIRG